MNKITPETKSKFSTMVAKRREEALINEANCIPPQMSAPFGNRKKYKFKLLLYNDDKNLSFFRFKSAAENVIMYAGSQRGKLDQISLIVLPLSFLIFTIIYWIIYLNESNKKIYGYT